MTHHLTCHVYYEDVDLAGIVYYANYLKYIERARSTMLTEASISQSDLKKAGFAFAVRRMEAEYVKPARFEDTLDVQSRISQMTATRLTFEQQVFRDDTLLFDATIEVVCIADTGRPARIPADIRAKFA